MSKTMSLRLSEQQVTEIQRWGRRHHQRSISATLQLLLEEKLREEKYPYISFQDSSAGRQACLMGTGLAVWEIMMVARGLGGDILKTAKHLEIPEMLVQAAFTYATDFADEIDAVLMDQETTDFEALKRLLPNLERITVPDESPGRLQAT